MLCDLKGQGGLRGHIPTICPSQNKVTDGLSHPYILPLKVLSGQENGTAKAGVYAATSWPYEETHHRKRVGELCCMLSFC